MPIAATLPSVTATPGDTIIGRKVVFAHLPTAGTQKNFLCTVADYKRDVQTLPRKAVDGTSGLIITDRDPVIEVSEEITLGFDEIGADALALFFNATSSTGTSRLWIKDPDDASNTAALLTNEFASTVRMAGAGSFRRDQYFDYTVTVKALAPITWTRDGSTA